MFAVAIRCSSQHPSNPKSVQQKNETHAWWGVKASFTVCTTKKLSFRKRDSSWGAGEIWRSTVTFIFSWIIHGSSTCLTGFLSVSWFQICFCIDSMVQPFLKIFLPPIGFSQKVRKPFWRIFCLLQIQQISFQSLSSHEDGFLLEHF